MVKASVEFQCPFCQKRSDIVRCPRTQSVFTVPVNIGTFSCGACGDSHQPGSSPGAIIGGVVALLLILGIVLAISFAGDSMFDSQNRCESDVGAYGFEGDEAAGMCESILDGDGY